MSMQTVKSLTTRQQSCSIISLQNFYIYQSALLTAVAFLCTRVQSPDTDDWKKLGSCLQYLQDSAELKYTLSANGTWIIRWWIDASYGVHPDLKSHTGATMSMGQGCLYSMSKRQKLNTRSSTEAELVGVNDAMGIVLWTRLFLEAQGYKINDNVIYQDNQSAILLKKNGKRKSIRSVSIFVNSCLIDIEVILRPSMNIQVKVSGMAAINCPLRL